jgi:hypothetical protein
MRQPWQFKDQPAMTRKGAAIVPARDTSRLQGTTSTGDSTRSAFLDWRAQTGDARVAWVPRWSGVRATERYDLGTPAALPRGPGLAMRYATPGTTRRWRGPRIGSADRVPFART